MNERITELVNGELDGTNTSGDSAELVGILDEDVSAKAFFDETKALFGALGNVPDADPPAELKQRIMESIGREARAVPASSQGLAATIQKLFQPVARRPAWAMSYAFAAGILVAIAGLNLTGADEISDSQVVQGTIGQMSSRILDEASLQVGDITVELTAVGLDQEIVLDVTITGNGDSVIRIETANESLDSAAISATGAGHFAISLDEMDDLVVTVTSMGQEASVRLQTSPV